MISLLTFMLSNNYFIYKDNSYKHIHGCAVGNPVSPVVANLCIKETKETAISETTVLPNVCKR